MYDALWFAVELEAMRLVLAPQWPTWSDYQKREAVAGYIQSGSMWRSRLQRVRAAARLAMTINPARRAV